MTSCEDLNDMKIMPIQVFVFALLIEAHEGHAFVPAAQAAPSLGQEDTICVPSFKASVEGSGVCGFPYFQVMRWRKNGCPSPPLKTGPAVAIQPGLGILGRGQLPPPFDDIASETITPMPLVPWHSDSRETGSLHQRLRQAVAESKSGLGSCLPHSR